MYVLEFLIYHLRPYGISSGNFHLNGAMSSAEQTLTTVAKTSVQEVSNDIDVKENENTVQKTRIQVAVTPP